MHSFFPSQRRRVIMWVAETLDTWFSSQLWDRDWDPRIPGFLSALEGAGRLEEGIWEPR